MDILDPSTSQEMVEAIGAPPPPLDVQADVCDAAADLLMIDGHVKRAARGKNNERCMVTAVVDASLADERSGRSGSYAVQRSLGQMHSRVRLRTAGESLVHFNDDPDTTTDDVIEWLRLAAKSLREEASHDQA